MIEPNLSDKTLDEWMQSQDPWPLDIAICLLLRVDPSSFKQKILRGNSKLPLIFRRALTHTFRALKRGDLEDQEIEHKIKKSAADYSVFKKDFVAWAEDDWDDHVPHLTEALGRYEALEEKPWSTPETQLEITHMVFNEVMKGLLPAQRKSISNRELHKMMKDHAGKGSGIYGLTQANPLLTAWKETYQSS